MDELKTPMTWARRGYTFLRHGSCPACSSPTETWLSPGGSEILLDPKTYESHFAGCNNARAYRQEQRMKEGVI